ncbi:ATP-binding protein [Pedobacter sp. Leaf250]|uniref:ATP-binding protein n=1 Tax=Pedobacter sp. Leaf250 TaxID=2876559 RepID=UPI00120FC06B|nr:ATP-binding protein [Pedobacter sp. Leaf250]RZJ90549.1 MAG: PAS domain-containing protein [Chryseobacterium sp.]
MTDFVNSLGNTALLDILLLSNDATAIYTGADLRIEAINQGMLDIFRKDKSVQGMPFEQAFEELKGQPFFQTLKDAYQTGQIYKAKDIPAQLNVDGQIKTYYFDFSYRPIKDNSGKIICILHTATEVSDRIHAIQLAREKELGEQQAYEQLQAINEEYQATNEELNAANEELQVITEEYHATNEELNAANEELNASNEQLQMLSEKLQTTNEELAQVNEEYQATNEELAQLNEEYTVTNEELNAANQILTAAGILGNKENIELSSLNIELKKRNIALAYSEKRALELFFDAPVAIGLLSGPELSIISANPELLRLWGKTGAILEKPLDEALPELKGQPFSEILHNVYSTGKFAYGTGEKVVLKRDGKLEDCFFNFIYKPIKDKKGFTHSIMIVAGEVTLQVKAIHTSQDISDRLSVALGAANLGSYDLELSTGKMECSDRCKLNFGRNIAEEFNFPDLMEAILPQYRDTVEKAITDAIANKGIYEAEYQIQLATGEQRWIHASGSPRYDSQNNPVRMVGVTLDITQRKAYEQRRDDFLSVAAHELKTPITVLKANLQLLERIKSQLENPKVKQLIEGASMSMAKVNILVEDLLNMSKHSGGRLELQKNWFDIPQILETCCNHVRIEGSHELIVTGEKHLKIFADEHRIEQVLVNLVNNAVKYAPESKKINLNVEKVEQFAKISVRDFGPGISQQQIPKLFDRYWQADKSSSSYTGLGLGLSICTEIIERHGGKIGVESTIGEGSTFWFTLPL